MQIHELNNYSGSLGDAYLVADNGSDTGKIKTTALTDPLNARIDNIIAGPASSAAEVIDARLGADGVTYPSLGDAVREQFSDITRDLNELTGEKLTVNYTNADLTQSGLYIDYEGKFSPNVNFSISEFIHIDGVDRIVVNSGEYLQTSGFNIAFYSLDNQFAFVGGELLNDKTLPYIINIPNGAEYVIFSNRNNGTINIDMVSTLSNGKIGELSDRINELTGNNLLKWKVGYYTPEGNYITEVSQSNFVTEPINRNDFTEIVVTPEQGYIVNTVLLNDNNEFISRGSWSSAAITITNTNNVRIMIATTEYSTYTLEQMLNNYVFEGAGDIGEIKKIDNKMTFLTRYMCCDSGNKIIHFSWDDVYFSLRDIINNSATYTSIFSNSFFASLKSIHDDTGAVFTLNCFNESTNYNIENLPTKYREELQANRHWLRFAFHGKNENSNYNSDTLGNDYNDFIDAIVQFTGDTNCIDPMPRLSYYGGTLANINAMKESSVPIIGLLTADDTRNSYYLSSIQNDTVINKGKYIDSENELIFFRSMKRLDNNSAEDVIAQIEGNNCYTKYTEIFAHEGSDASRMRTVAEWANTHGYVHAFPCDIFR